MLMLQNHPDINQLHGDELALLFIVIVMSGVLIEQNKTNIHCIRRKIYGPSAYTYLDGFIMCRLGINIDTI